MIADKRKPKAQEYQQEIRKKYIEGYFSNVRNSKLQKQHNIIPHEIQFMGEMDPINQQIVKRSLIKNDLLHAVINERFLQSCEHKLSQNPSIRNIQFIASICANILFDDLQLQHKQKIFHMLIPKYLPFYDINQKISPMIQTYFYQNFIWGAYQNLSQNDQIKAQQIILPRLLALMKNSNSHNLTHPSYSPQQIQQTIWQNCSLAYLHYFTPDKDHNTILLYKITRNKQLITQLINLLHLTMNTVNNLNMHNNSRLLINPLIITNIFYNIFNADECMFRVIFAHGNLQKIFMAIFMILEESRNYGKKGGQIGRDCLAVIEKVIKSYGDDVWYISQLMADNRDEIQEENKLGVEIWKLKLLLDWSYAEGSPQILEIYFNIWQSLPQTNQIRQYTEQLLLRSIDILQQYQKTAPTSLTIKSLKLIFRIFEQDYKQGSNQHILFFKNHSGVQAMEGIYIATKNNEICQIIDDIWSFIDIC